MDKLYQDRTKCPQIENLEKITPEQAIEYIRYVADIRDKQRRWFTQHDYNALAVARKMERELDALNAHLLDPTPRLF